jgi:hypothetical protein
MALSLDALPGLRRPLLRCAAIAVLLGGCASGQWTKAGSDATAVSRDLDECRGVALGRSGPPVVTPRSSESVSDLGRPGAMQPAAGSSERFVAEHEAVSRCMHKKGYQLR